MTHRAADDQDSYRKRQGAEQRERLARVLDAALVESGLSHSQVAEALAYRDSSVRYTTVSDWRNARAALPFYHAQAVAKTLTMRDAHTSNELFERFGYDPLIMIRAFGLLPEDAHHAEVLQRLGTWAAPPTDVTIVKRLLELEHLDAEIAEREDQLSAVERDRGAVALTRAIIDSKKYAAAVWPVFAGTKRRSGGPIHVSDLIDIRRLDGAPIDDRKVWKELQHPLTHARALPSSATSRWSTPPPPDAAVPADPQVSLWVIRRLDAPRRPQVRRAHPGFPAVVISATVSNTWLGYVASMVAFVLGYGLTSTTDLARNHSRDASFMPETDARNAVQNGLLSHPDKRLVWTHAAKLDPDNPHGPWAAPDRRVARRLLHVRLVEDDDLLESTARDRNRWPGHAPIGSDAVASWQASREEALARMPVDDWHVALPVPDAPAGSEAKWKVTLGLAVDVLNHLKALGLKPWEGMEEMHEAHSQQDPTVAGAALDWLREHGAPFTKRSSSVTGLG